MLSLETSKLANVIPFLGRDEAAGCHGEPSYAANAGELHQIAAHQQQMNAESYR